MQSSDHRGMSTVPTCRVTDCRAEAVTGLLGTHLPILVCQPHADAFADRVPYQLNEDRTGLTFAAQN